jgi:hypothetical protein
VITGYNTDVEFEGVTYHVQTEDKGLQTPVILSLVYSGGAILASKRSPYDDLVSQGFDESVLAARLQRQHKLICAAVHAGRLEDLKQMAQRDSTGAVPTPEPVAAQPVESAPDNVTPEAEAPIEAPADRFSISETEPDEEGLSISFADSEELRAGNTVTLKLKVRRRSGNGRKNVGDARVTVKTLGTNFPPQSTFATTDNRGAATVSISLPHFTAGRGAVLIQVESNGEVAELRKIILPANE